MNSHAWPYQRPQPLHTTKHLPGNDSRNPLVWIREHHFVGTLQIRRKPSHDNVPGIFPLQRSAQRNTKQPKSGTAT
ncbi:hypothetical protein AC579_495 [Pseudocercospora musae]|uniref:Uncharacterized protein n=1 Tax=Pseudocercospora musae TaxID=113226 RepID=A0A139INI2_9PEZI|nr:hypothetical protein AC579_495 [Pseudocercospora musae]